MYTPIAIKSFGLDQESGLEKQLQVRGQFSDAKNECIIIYYDIVLLSPTNMVFSTIKTGFYTRTGIKFNQLRESPVGQQITSLIGNDLDMILSYDTIDNDLKQTTF